MNDRLLLQGWGNGIRVTRLHVCLAVCLASLLMAATFLFHPGVVHAAPPPGDPLKPGSSAVVRADGDCVRVRDQPALSARQLSCLGEGTVVAVLPSTQLADGYRWQLINYGTLTGWAADTYLQPAAANVTATTAACVAANAPSAPKPGLSGFVPTKGGTGLLVWGGGTLAGVDNAATSKGCKLDAVWTNRADGELVAYLPGAPDFVNAPWRAAFPDGRLSSGRVLMLVCDPLDAIHATIATVPLPAFNAPAPTWIGPAQAPPVSARSAVVIDEASGAILYGKDPHLALPPASLTKIATAIVAIEGTEPTSWVSSSVDSRTMIGSSVVGLIPGDCFRMSDLLYGLMLPSGNDAALAIARYQAGSDESFVAQMNTLVARLGLKDSHFTDSDGLGSPQHLMSAYDIAMLARYGMTLPQFRNVVNTPAWTATGGRTLSMLNVNQFLKNYAGADGIKTGYTEEAGSTLAVSATRNGHRVYAVLMNDDNRYTDAQALMDWAFADHRWP